MLDVTESAFRAIGSGLPGAFNGVSGVSLGLDAQDTWQLSGPFSLIAGLGYRHAIEGENSSLLVPRVGGSWAMERLALRFLVSYHALADGAPAGSASPAYDPAERLGYDAFVEVPLPHELRVAAVSTYVPLQLDPLGLPGASGSALAPIYLTDGNIALSRNHVAVTKEGASTRTFLELGLGSADGTLAAVLPYEVAFQRLSERSLDFHNGRLGLHVMPTGTDVVLEYLRVEERPEVDPIGGSSLQRSLELRLAQDVMRRRDLGNWRFLMAVRLASLVADPSDDALEGTDVALLDSLSRISAGLSVEF
jgi:hypothetical protein